MKYMCLLYGVEPTSAPSPAEMQAELDAYNVFSKEVVDRGLMLGGEALHPASTATTVRVRNGKTTTTDGPFAETKEVLGGFYLLDCKNLDEALEMAAKIPAAKVGSVEVRPVVDFSQQS
jgi:hypothetical protein